MSQFASLLSLGCIILLQSSCFLCVIHSPISQSIEEAFEEVDILRDSSEPDFFDGLEDTDAEEDTKELQEKLEEAKEDLLKLKSEEEKKSQVQKQFLARIGEVDKLNRDNTEKFALIGEAKKTPEEIKEQLKDIKVSLIMSVFRAFDARQ